MQQSNLFQLDFHGLAGMKLKSEHSLLRRLRAVIVDDIDSEVTIQPVLQSISFGANYDSIPPDSS